VAINASIITDTAKDITKRTVVDYGAGVFAHTTKDWERHNVVQVYPSTAYTNGGVTVAALTLRLVATQDDSTVAGLDLAIAVPINSAGTTAITNSPPIIIQQPINTTAPPLSTVQLRVGAISDIALTYQWQKLISAVWTNISGATATSLVLTGVTANNDGSYRVIVSNANGSVTSNVVTLLVTSGASGEQGEGFFEGLPQVRLFHGLFG
jgi:hypothetical protein